MTGPAAPDCAELGLLLHALVDDELDAANAARCEQHVARCARCAQAYAEALAVRKAMSDPQARHQAPEALRARVLQSLQQATAPARQPARTPRRTSWLSDWLGGWRALAMPGLAAAATAALLLVALPRGADPGLALRDAVLAGHVRALQLPGHLADVGSSDHHTVKPWFAGKLDFSPPVPELAAAGFPLAGGRLDYLDGRAVAALVYRRRAHVINVFVWPSAGTALPTPVAGGDAGHAMLRWAEGGMAFWAVSDLNLAELEEFARLFRAEAAVPPPPPA